MGPFPVTMWLAIRTLGEDAWAHLISCDRPVSNTRGMCLFWFAYHVTKLYSKIVDKLGLSYNNIQQLNDKVDGLPGCPSFQCRGFSIGGEQLDFYYRDVLECIRSLFGNPQFTQDLAFVPERHYTSPDCTCRLYNEMYMGDWWWTVQVHTLDLHEYHY